MKRVVVTGRGVVAPNGTGKTAFTKALVEGRSGITHLKDLEEKKFSCQVAGVCADVDTELGEYLASADISAMSQGMKFGALAALEAYDEAGLERLADDASEPLFDTGAIIGTGIGGLDVFADTVFPAVANKKVRRMGSAVVEQIMCSGPSAKIAGIFGLGNQVTANSSACSTGTEAIIMGADRIREGKATRMLVGGVEAAHSHIWAGFDSMRVLSRKFNDTPEAASRPMSESAAGFVPGSGAGVLVIEDLESAQRRGATIFAEIVGSSINCGGMRAGGSMTAPSALSVKRCIREALLAADCQPSDIDYINGHLTATMADPIELNNWHEALELAPEKMPFVNSTKSMIGHGLGAAGAMETVATLLQMEKGFLHPSINCEDLHPKIEKFQDRIVRSKLNNSINVAAKASFGFGDVNSCLIFKKWS